MASGSSAIRPDAARSVAHRELPAAPANLPRDSVSLVLFYQYVEPQWTEKEHKEALKNVINLGNRCGVKGRGRCAAEGLNCTLTGSPDAVRAFCRGLRAWKPAVFDATDFKITDGLSRDQHFKAFTIQKKDDLVGYGLPSELAPSLTTSKARHADADEYHKLMANPDAVIVDVRNAYESAIGHFQPPQGGAKLIDPKMRNSIEFAPWINAPETQALLHGKQVLMYCTGGIRCERASALLDALARTSGGAFQPKETVMVRGGIERYMKTFPNGGYWRGKNYLFDRRREQVPEHKSSEALESEVESWCCVCHQKCGYYLGQFTCAGWLKSTAAAPVKGQKCDVPVIVCQSCARRAPDPRTLRCPLCEEGYLAPKEKPDLQRLKAAFEASLEDGAADNSDSSNETDDSGGTDESEEDLKEDASELNAPMALQPTAHRRSEEGAPAACSVARPPAKAAAALMLPMVLEFFEDNGFQKTAMAFRDECDVGVTPGTKLTDLVAAHLGKRKHCTR